MHSQVGVREVVARLKRLLEGDDLVESDIGVELGLNLGEDRNRAVRASTAELALRLKSGRDRDGVVEGQAERLVCLGRAQTAMEEVLLQVLTDGEQLAACGIRCGVNAVGARYAARQRGWWRRGISKIYAYNAQNAYRWCP